MENIDRAIEKMAEEKNKKEEPDLPEWFTNPQPPPDDVPDIVPDKYLNPIEPPIEVPDEVVKASTPIEPESDIEEIPDIHPIYEPPPPPKSLHSKGMIWKAQDILARAPADIEWVWDQLLGRRLITVMFGGPKSGKSTLYSHLIRRMQEGLPFLGQSTCLSSALVLTEEPIYTLRKKFNWTIEMPIQVASDDVYFMFSWENPGQWFTLIKQTKKEIVSILQIVEEFISNYNKDHNIKIGLLVVDSFANWSRMAENEENSSSAILTKLRPLREMIDRLNIAALIVHHTRKAGGESFERMRGSSALAGEADVLIDFDFGSGKKNGIDKTHRILTIESRVEHPDKIDCHLELNEKWEELSYTLLPKQDYGITDDIDAKLHEYLKQHGSATKEELRKATGILSQEQAGIIAYNFIKKYKMESTGKGTKGDAKKWHLPKEGECNVETLF